MVRSMISRYWDKIHSFPGPRKVSDSLSTWKSEKMGDGCGSSDNTIAARINK